MNQVEQVREKLLGLEKALNDQLPGIPSMLRTIHQILKKDEELVTLLSEEECAVLVNGLKKQTATEIATSALKAPRGKSLKSTTLNDL